MSANRFYFVMLIFMVLLLGYLTFQIFQPFLTAIAWAIVFCVVFYPVYAFSLRFLKMKAAASLLTLLLIIVAIVGPFSYVSFVFINEVTDFIGRTEKGESEVIGRVMSDPRVIAAIQTIKPYIGLEERSAEEIILENSHKIGKVIIDKLSAGFTNVLSVTATFVFTIFTIFFLLKDGPDFLGKLRDYLPFSEQQKDRLASQTKDMIVSTIYGGVIVAIVQGLIGGIAFAVLDIGSPVLWGSVMALASFIPMLGTGIVWVPASVLLLLQGTYMKGIALALVGVFVISMVDNILKPLIIGGRTKMPTVIIFFTVLGGIKFFGLLGLIMGPLVFALFLSVFEIFRTIEGGDNA